MGRRKCLDFYQLHLVGAISGASIADSAITERKIATGAIPKIVFRPGGIAEPGVVVTWDDLQAKILANPVPLEIIIDLSSNGGGSNNITTPAYDIDFRNATLTGSLSVYYYMHVVNGCTLFNISRLKG